MFSFRLIMLFLIYMCDFSEQTVIIASRATVLTQTVDLMLLASN